MAMTMAMAMDLCGTGGRDQDLSFMIVAQLFDERDLFCGPHTTLFGVGVTFDRGPCVTSCRRGETIYFRSFRKNTTTDSEWGTCSRKSDDSSRYELPNQQFH